MLSTGRSCERTWDLIVSYFGDDPNIYRDIDATRIDSKGPKLAALKSLLMRHPELMSQYSYVFIPDDDLDGDCHTVNKLFETCETYGLTLAQPSLSIDSFVAHPITLHNSHYILRFTNWVEVMAPCFFQTALIQCLETFDANTSGWGVELLWIKALQNLSAKIAVVDCVQVRHTRPFGGPHYALLKQKKSSPTIEFLSLLDKHQLEFPSASCYGAIDLHGRTLSQNELNSRIQEWNVPPWGMAWIPYPY
jgi:hypothetical protein